MRCYQYQVNQELGGGKLPPSPCPGFKKRKEKKIVIARGEVGWGGGGGCMVIAQI